MPASTPTSQPTRRQLTAWRNALFVIFALCGVGLASWAARVPAVKDALELTSSQLGVLLFGIAAGSIVGLVAASHLVSTFGARTVITGALATAPVGLAAASFAATELHNFAFTFVALAVFGAGTGICDVAMNVSGAANERALARTVMPVYHAFFSGGTVAGAGLGAFAEKLAIPFALHIGVLAVLIVVVTFSTVRLLQPEVVVAEPSTGAPAAPPHGTWRSRLSSWRDPRTLVIGLIVLGMAFAEGSATDWLPIAMVDGHGTDRPTGALVFGVFVSAMTIGRLAGVSVLDRFGRVPVLRASAVLACIGLLMLIFVPIIWVAVVGVVFWGLGASLGFPVGMSAAADDPSAAAARVSAVATIGYLAFLVGPPVIGFLADQFGILNGLLLVLVLVAAAGAVSPAAREPRKTTVAS